MTQEQALEVRFGRCDGRWWRVGVFPHPEAPGLYSYRLEIGADTVGGGLRANPVLHGGYKTVQEALQAGVSVIFGGQK